MQILDFWKQRFTSAFIENAEAGETDKQKLSLLGRQCIDGALNGNRLEFEINDISPGAEAGIMSVEFTLKGRYAYGLMTSERGTHRLVRISPFDNQGRRQTSFSNVQVWPAMENPDIEIDETDVRMEVFRASGAGGQHVNKTESAVRIRHMPSGIVVACQNERSQHKNRATAMKMLKAKLYELEVNKRNAAAKVLEDSKSDVSWGHQIRSYVLDQSRIKDLRTDVEIGNTTAVLDGDLDPFLEASLKAGL